jgi:transposase
VIPLDIALADRLVLLAEISARAHVGVRAGRSGPDFADLMNKQRGDRLPDWMLRVQADNVPALHSLVTGLRRDLDAVTAGLTMTWSSGPVEGAVNRIKQ